MAAPQFYTGMSYSQLIQLLQASIAPNGTLTAPLTIDRSDGVTAGTTFGANGNVTIAAPSSGIGLTVNAATGNTTLTVNHTRNVANVAVRFQETGFDDVGWEFQRGNSTRIFTVAYDRANSLYANHSHYALSHTFFTGTSPTTALTIGSSGNVTVATPSSGDAFTASGIVAGNSYAATLNAGTALGGNAGALKVVGVAAGSAVMNFTAQGTTGGAIPTFANNKPGANTSTAGWLPVGIDGVLRYIPYWS